MADMLYDGAEPATPMTRDWASPKVSFLSSLDIVDRYGFKNQSAAGGAHLSIYHHPGRAS